VSHDFCVDIFSMHVFFLHYPSVLICFLFSILFCSYTSGCPRRATTRHTHEDFNRTTHKVVKDAISYAHIQANNTYYKDVLGLEMNKKLGSSSIYSTEDNTTR
jgi:hypothetical protein